MTTDFKICKLYRKTLFEESIKDLLESITVIRYEVKCTLCMSGFFTFTLTAIMKDPTGYKKDADEVLETKRTLSTSLTPSAVNWC